MIEQFTRNQVAALVGMSPTHFSVAACRGQVPLAFGACPNTARKLLPIDILAIRIAQEVATMVGRSDAADIVRTYGDHWMETAGRADADPGGFYYFAVLVAGRGKNLEYMVASGKPEEIVDDVNRSGFPHWRICTVNVTRILADLRERGRRHKIDLTAAFFPPPTHPAFRSLIEGSAEVRREKLAALEAIKSEEANTVALQ